MALRRRFLIDGAIFTWVDVSDILRKINGDHQTLIMREILRNIKLVTWKLIDGWKEGDRLTEGGTGWQTIPLMHDWYDEGYVKPIDSLQHKAIFGMLISKLWLKLKCVATHHMFGDSLCNVEQFIDDTWNDIKYLTILWLIDKQC